MYEKHYVSEVYMSKKTKSPYVVAAFLFVVGIGYMVWSGVSQSSVYFLNVSEALAMSSEEFKSARLFGKVGAEGLVRTQDGTSLTFILHDADQSEKTLSVNYKGVVPDTFTVGVEVIIEGVMQEDTFHAKSLMTKCPSKYESENRTKV